MHVSNHRQEHIARNYLTGASAKEFETHPAYFSLDKRQEVKVLRRTLECKKCNIHSQTHRKNLKIKRRKKIRKRQGRAQDKGNEKASAHVSMDRETNKRDKRS